MHVYGIIFFYCMLLGCYSLVNKLRVVAVSPGMSKMSTKFASTSSEVRIGLNDLVWNKFLDKSEKAQLDPKMTLIMGQCFNWQKLNMPSKAVWVTVVEGRALAIKSEDDCTYYADLLDPNCNHDEYLKQYFQLGHNLEDLYAMWGEGCSRMKTVTAVLPGVRVLRQDPWECLISFICSSNNNIKRITLMLDRLKRAYGSYVCSVKREGDSYVILKVPNPPVIEIGKNGIDSSLFATPQKMPMNSTTLAEAEEALTNVAVGQEDSQESDRVIHLFDFPAIDSLANASEADLRALGMGYRAKFLKGSAEKVLAFGGLAWLLALRRDSVTIYGEEDVKKEADEKKDGDNSYSANKKSKSKKKDKDFAEPLSHRLWVNQQLQLLPGVGRKVADCVAVFSLDQSESVPVDVHVWDIAVRDYNPNLQTALSLTPVIYEQVGDLFRERFRLHAGWAHSVLFAAELPEFKSKLPVSMQEEMDLFDEQQRLVKAEKRESAKKRKLAKAGDDASGAISESAMTPDKMKL